MPAGRPSTYSEEKTDEICNRLMAGESLTSICRDDAMPGQKTVFEWLASHPVFAQKYARAREIQYDVLAESIIDIADASPDTFIRTEGRGENQREIVCVDGAAVAHQRNRIDARKWWVSKVAAKKYGDKVQAELSGNVTLTASPLDEAL